MSAQKNSSSHYRISAITVYYKANGPTAPAAPTFEYNGSVVTASSVVINPGDRVNVSCEEDAKLVVNDAEQSGFEYDIEAAGTYEAYAKRNGLESDKVTLTVTMADPTFVPVPAVTYNGVGVTGSVEIMEGQSVDITSAEGTTLYINGTAQTGNSGAVSEPGTYTVYAKRGEYTSEEVTFTVSVMQAMVFTMVENTADVTVGALYVVTSGSQKAMGALLSNNTYSQVEVKNKTSNTVEIDPATTAVFTYVKEDDGNYYLKEGNSYIKINNNNTGFSHVDSYASATAIDITINTTSHSAEIVGADGAGNDRHFRNYNDSDFRTYKTSTTTGMVVYLYKRQDDSEVAPTLTFDPAAGTVDNQTDVTVKFDGFNGKNDEHFAFVSLTDGGQTVTDYDAATHSATINIAGMGTHTVTVTYTFRGQTMTESATYTIAGPAAPKVEGATVANGKIVADLNDTFTVSSRDGGVISVTADPAEAATFDAATGTVTILGEGVLTAVNTVENLGATTSKITIELRAPGAAVIADAAGTAITAASVDAALNDIFTLTAANDGDTVSYTVAPADHAAEVEGEGTRLQITAVGSTTITAWAERNGKRGTETTLTVKVPDPNFVAAPTVTFGGTAVSGKVEIMTGQEVTVTGPADATLYINGTAQTGNTASITKDGTYTVYAQRGEFRSEEVTFTVAVKVAKVYKLVTPEDEILVNAHYVISNIKVESTTTETPAGMANPSAGTYYKAPVDAYDTEAQTVTIAPDSNIDVFVLVKEDDGKQYLKVGDNFIKVTANNSGFYTATTAAEATHLEMMSINKDNGRAQIKMNGRYFRYYSTGYSTGFRTYPSESNSPVYLYIDMSDLIPAYDVTFANDKGDIEETVIDATVGDAFSVRALNEDLDYDVDYSAEPADGVERLSNSKFRLAEENGTVTVTAWGVKDGKKGYPVTLTLRAHDANYVAAPTFPASSTLEDGAMLRLTCAKAGATIYYRTVEDGAWLPYPEDGIATKDLGWVFTVWAKAECNGHESEIVSKSFSVAAARTYELVTKDMTVLPSDQFIIVTHGKFIPQNYDYDGPNKQTGWTGPSVYWALSSSTYNDYHKATEVSEGYDPNTIMVQPGQDVIVFSIQPGPETDSDRKYLFRNATPGPDYGLYVYVDKEKHFSFKALPTEVEERLKMNGSLKIFDATDYFQDPAAPSSTANKADYTDKIEVVFSGTANDAEQTTILRFNPLGNYPHFNCYKADELGTDGSRSSTYPVQIYRLTQHVDKPSITVFNEAGEYAYDQALTTFNNKVKVEIEAHPRTSDAADMYYTWSDRKNAPTLDDYTMTEDNLFTLYVDGDTWYYEDGTEGGKIGAPGLNAERRVLYAMSALGDIQSTPTSRLLTFRTLPAKLTKTGQDADAQTLSVRIDRGATYTRGAILRYTTDGSDPVTSSEAIIAAPGSVVTMPFGSTLRVAAMKNGYESTEVTFDDATVFPECRPMQLLRISDLGLSLEAVASALEASGIDVESIDADHPVYINHRQDVDDPGTPDFHYFFQRQHEYGETEHENRGVKVEKVDHEVFDAIFADPNFYYWTSDYYVFVLNTAEFASNFASEPTDISAEVEDADKVYTCLVSEVDIKGQDDVKYFGAMLENSGSIGVKDLRSTVTYTIDGKEYTTENNATITPIIPMPHGVRYRHTLSKHSTTIDDAFQGYEYVKFTVPSALSFGDDAPAGWAEQSPVLANPAELNPRRLDAVLKFTRPNISPMILEHYDIYYTINFYAHNDDSAIADRLLHGSGIYRDEEKSYDATDDKSYRFKINDLSPQSTVNPMIELAEVRFISNENDESYSSFNANYVHEGEDMVAVARNNPRKGNASIGNVWLDYTENADGTIDWTYIGHTDLASQDVIADSDPDDETTADIYLEGMFFHLEINQGGQYRSYEHLVQHYDGHRDPDDYANPYKDRDPLVFTTIAKGLPKVMKDNGTMRHPDITFAPVYLFRNNVNAFNEAWDESVDIEEETSGTGTVGLSTVRLFEVPTRPVPVIDGATAPATAPARAARRAYEDNELPRLPHTGEVDVNGENVLDLSGHPSYIIVKGQEVTVDGAGSNVMTGVENISADTDGEVLYYNLQGVRTQRPERGVVIRVAGGRATKELHTGR